ncbi:similar to 4-coumarate-CoA ligase [Botrytis cinerea T4]|uniref:Similar to 4-coumarate-CoA ligase n=1 Tax=Botryotinia fuckeliana (strain T4) TaxID=999810 RepID=G2Y9R8_BOTF4|nr:similar to 4-coumarate-CoA ligase [Botrytis cinerea T4]
MPISSRWHLSIPSISLPTYLFTSSTHPLPDKLAFIDASNPSQFLTQSDFRLYSQRLAAGLIKNGLQPGDRVLLFSSNNLFFPVIIMGIIMAGGIFTGANPGFVERELAYQLSDCGAKFLLCGEGGLEVGIKAAGKVGLGREKLFVFDDIEKEIGIIKQETKGLRSWWELLETEEVGGKFQWKEDFDPKEAVCCLNYSSGTTGVPKGVMITHYNYVANSIQYRHLHELHPETPERNKKAKWLCFLPLYHAMGQTIFGAVAPKRGIPVYIMKKFDFKEMLEAVQKYRITSLSMVPPIVVMLVKSPLTKQYDLSSILDMASGAAPLSGEVIDEVEKLWPNGNVKLTQGWGMTEATCSLLGCDPRQDPVPNSVGELNANCHAKIMDPETLEELKQGERGEIWVQAPNVMKGYWKKPSATQETLINSPSGIWLRTGDIAYVDSRNHFFIVDRMKELIKVKGNQVAPAELEALLLEHPEIADAAVIGVMIGEGEVPRAYIVKSGGSGNRLNAEEVMGWVEKRTSRFKWLKGGVEFVEAIPKNPSGKILRKLLREKAKEEISKIYTKARL